MEKVGIVTLQGLYNYGNRLQNYAVQQIIRKYGYTVESIIFKGNLKEEKVKIFAFLAESRLTNPFRYFLRFFNFWKFNRKKIALAKFKCDQDAMKKIKSEYKFLALGGDQIWNQKYNIFGELDEKGFQFGSAVDSEFRIPFAPSFGESSIPKGKYEYCKKWLNEIKYLSVREQSGAEIIKELTGRDSTIVIDPVMVLSAEEWKSLFNSNKKYKTSYVLTCFLGGSTEERSKQVEGISKNLEIKTVGRYEDKDSWAGPDKFLSLIYHADIICTDSFHCLAFAILFNKPFVVFDRLNCDISQMTRLENIMNLFGFEDRHIDRIDMNKIEIMDYSKTEEILQEQRKIFYSFIEQWL